MGTPRTRLSDPKGWERAGEGWERPRWRQALLWLRWRPWCWLKGEYWNAFYKAADRFGEIGPLRRQWWIGEGAPTQETDTVVADIIMHYEDEQCDCGRDYTGTIHHLIWVKAPDYRWIGDDWSRHDDRSFAFRRPSKGADRQDT